MKKYALLWAPVVKEDEENFTTCEESTYPICFFTIGRDDIDIEAFKQTDVIFDMENKKATMEIGFSITNPENLEICGSVNETAEEKNDE